MCTLFFQSVIFSVLPCFKLEALECFSSSLNMLGTADQGSELGDRHGVLSDTLKPLPRKSFNWLSPDVSVHLEFHIRLNLALQYLSKLIKQHPSWPDFFVESNKEASYSDEYMLQYEKSLERFKQRLYTELALFEQRFSLAKSCLISMVCCSSTLKDSFCSCFLVDLHHRYFSSGTFSLISLFCRFYFCFAIMDCCTLDMM